MSYTYGVKRGESIPVVMVSQLKKTLFVAMPAPLRPHRALSGAVERHRLTDEAPI